jgi:uncharacterized repeat protein (TIGR01451 family)
VIAKGTPTLTFNAQSGVNYAPGGATFTIPTPATFSPALAQTQLLATYTSSTPSVCTMPGTTSTTVTIVSAGTCTITASFAGDANWNAAATPAARTIAIAKINQTVTMPTQTTTTRNWSSGATFPITPLATTTAAAQPGIAIVYTSGNTSVCTISGTTVTIGASSGTCQIIATEDGNTNYNSASASTNVTINPVAPSAPTILTPTAGDTQASVPFTGSATTGGQPITTYTATCTAAGQATRSAASLTSPIIVTGMVNNVTYACSVTATNQAALTSAASGSLNVTPVPTPVPPQITSANNTTFTVTQAGNFNVTATGTPAPTITITGALPSGVTFTPGTSPRALAGTPASGTAGTYPLTFTATATNPPATQSFTLTVAKKSQTINFTDPADRGFSNSTVPLVASATSGLAVTFTSLTPAICSVTGANATMLGVGDCGISAQQAGDADWAAASPQPTQSFTISQGTQSITFGAQLTASRSIVPGGAFTLNPTATASSGLPVTYSTSTPTVCTANGTSITMLATGTCTIVASQSGDTHYLAATDASQDVSITISSQSIAFPAQPPQPFSPGGAFQVSNPATASSGLPVTYSTDTTTICNVAGTTVSIVAVGTCTLKADQAGNANFTPAATATADVSIQAVAPDAPTIGTATPANSQATLTFTAPANDGGSAITGYIATCNPGGFTGTGNASPIVVTGLANNSPYTCSVAAINLAGTGASSASLPVTPSQQGPALWAANCQACHGPVPNGARFNAAGTTTTVLDYVIANNPGMDMTNAPWVHSLTPLERSDLVAHITSYLAPIDEQTTPNVAKTLSVASHLTLGSVSFTRVVVDTPPAHGTLSAFNGTTVVYTPDAGYVGPDSFTYHGQRDTPTSLGGDPRTVTITVTASASLLTVTPAGTGGGVVTSTLATNGIDCGSDCSEAYIPGTVVSLQAAQSPGSTFIGWSGACAGTGPCSVTMSAARNVTATFDLTPFDLSVSKAGLGSGSVGSNPGGISCGATCTAGFAPGTPVTLSHLADPGSQFTGWSGACTGSGACIVTMDAAKGVTATFARLFTLAVTKSGTGSGSIGSTPAGIACGATCSADYLEGTPVALDATPAAGSAFMGWSGACSGTGACNVTMDAAKSVGAAFAPLVTLTVGKSGAPGTVTSAPAGIDCGATCSADFAPGTIVTLTALAGTDAAFTGWSGACSGTGACNVTMDTAKSVTATFAAAFTLTVTKVGTGSGYVTSAPAGIGCGVTCSTGFDPGTVVILGKSPAAGSVFAGWSGACTGTGNCTVTMSQSRAVTATFNTVVAGSEADLSIASQSSDPYAGTVGANVTFTLGVTNNGPDAATGVVLTDTLPPGTIFVSAAAGCSQAAGVVTCNVGNLAAGASVQVGLVARPTAAGSITNVASVAAAQGDPFGFNNTSSLTMTVNPAAPGTGLDADVAITQVATPNPAQAGKDVTFTLTATNNGPASATSVTITEAVPAGASYVWSSPGCASAAGTVTCQVASIASGASAVVKIVVNPLAAGSITSNPSVIASEPDLVVANNSASLVVPVGATPGGVPVQRYRLYSPVTLEHHFTTDLNEYNVLGALVGTWVQEGGVGKVLNNPGSFGGVMAVPYYRLYDTATRWHHWTTDANEYYTLGTYPGWNLEGVDGYILPSAAAGATQLYRLNYPALGSLHHWTIDANEYATLINSFGWIGEGGSGFVVQ